MKQRKDKNLAEGELTGHAHRVVADDAEVFDVDENTRHLKAPTGAAVVHEEHKTVELPAQNYSIRRQREIDPDTEEIKQVRD